MMKILTASVDLVSALSCSRTLSKRPQMLAENRDALFAILYATFQTVLELPWID